MTQRTLNKYTKADIKKLVPELTKSVTFKLIFGQPPYEIKKVKHYTQNGENGMTWDGPFQVAYPNIDTVKIGNRFVDIAFTTNEDPDNPEFGDIIFEKAQGYQMTCDPGNFEHEKKYEYLMLTNRLKDNPNRSKNITPEIEIWDDENIADANLKLTEAISDAQQLILGMIDQEILENAANLGKDMSKSVKVLQNELIQDMNDDNLRKRFLSSNSDSSKSIVLDIKECEKLGGIKWDETQHAWIFSAGGGVIETFARGSGAGFGRYEQFKRHLASKPKLLSTIQLLTEDIKKREN